MTLRDWVASRVKAILDAGYGDDLARRWPEGVPTLRASSVHNDVELDAIAAACTDIEARHGMAFPPESDPRSAHPAKGAQTPTTLAPSGPDEGDPVDPVELTMLADAISHLEPAESAMVDLLARATADAGRSVNLGLRPSRRRLEIAWALITLSGLPFGDVAEHLAAVTGCDRDAEVGAVVGQLSTDQAIQLQTLTAKASN